MSDVTLGTQSSHSHGKSGKVIESLNLIFLVMEILLWALEKSWKSFFKFYFVHENVWEYHLGINYIKYLFMGA